VSEHVSGGISIIGRGGDGGDVDMLWQDKGSSGSEEIGSEPDGQAG